ncbi:AAA family ATPase [Roseovarius mucosus]|uniref:AAA family ATPase n=1 Tax=Roseovarius mucosus TaxID=215743 RepID=UPI001C5CD5BC|nr:AAA family ATPase [Roseovarius mucosus]MBW4973313.1 AAA family ATPase [Roseovarius mucosus]
MVNKRLEKYALFSEDFKGLPDGWHNLRACNFLVGENSTGKSSFLQLIELIDSKQHMLFLDILDTVDGIESVFDVCSRISGSKVTTIGFLIKEQTDIDESLRIRARLITYKAVRDEFLVMKVTIVHDDIILRLKRGKNRISFRYDKFSYDPSISHAENGAKIEDMHSKSDRFNQYHEVEWGSQADNWTWLEALNAAIRGEDGKPRVRFLNYPPLGCFAHGPMRAKTRRLHHGAKSHFSSVGEHTPYMLRDVLTEEPELAEAINEFGRVSGLFDEIVVNTITTKVKDKPFVLQVRKSERYFYVDELGFGVGQVLPIITDISFYRAGTSFLIQQPELHLHPKAQAALGDLFYSASSAGKCLVIETHSDFIVDRFRMALKKNGSGMRSQVIYFDKTESGENSAHEIEINGDGSFMDPPDNFRSFFLKESIDKFELL